MQFKIPDQYVIGKFFQYTGFPVYKSSIKAYNACCPVCREGNSWGKKKRLFYFPDKQQLYCHNCNQGWTPAKWIKQVCNITYQDIKNEILSGENNKAELDINEVVAPSIERRSLTLPDDSINLFDKEQVVYYKNNNIVRIALKTIKERLLHKAYNKSSALYVSLTDYVHKNRLCIPFYDLNKKIIFYQTRRILEDGSAKYLSKLYEEKSVYGVDKIDSAFPYIFVLEGPIDAMFIKNGVAVCGTHITAKQHQQLSQFPTHEIIWCLDNQNIDKASHDKSVQLQERGYNVFWWPKSSKYKDFNEMCVSERINEVDPAFILSTNNRCNSFSMLSSIGFKKPY